ncbi:hypothetical protein VTJ04DRAFT_2748 [Mycothermus thermophilus]|uniref:uncharacterized protein n=1 Tax=Humicola insolens TaxID=85995 RepID=UPI0037446613
MLFVFEGNINGTGGDHTVSPTQRATLERHYRQRVKRKGKQSKMRKRRPVCGTSARQQEGKKNNEHQPIQKQYIGLGLSPGRGWERPTVGIS